MPPPAGGASRLVISNGQVGSGSVRAYGGLAGFLMPSESRLNSSGIGNSRRLRRTTSRFPDLGRIPRARATTRARSTGPGVICLQH
jgi:hypothetical protein